MAEKEHILLQQVKHSDKGAFKTLFSLYHDTLFRFVFYRVKDNDLAEDITQDPFLRVWKTRESLQPKKSFFSLIARISSNLCYDYFRHENVKHRHEDFIPIHGHSELDNPEVNTHASALEEEIQEVINNYLPNKCRNIFILSRIEGKSNPEIAAILDLSVRTVENQIYRALKILRKHLKKYL